MRATIKDVAAQAGVSIKTVSRVLNKERYVGAATRERVEAVVTALNFRPSSAARSLAGRRSFQIGLICDNPSPYYVYAIQAGVRDRCEAEGVRMLAQPYDRGAGGGLTDAIEALIDTTHVDGLILTPPASDDAAVLDLLKRRNVRFTRVSPGVRPDASASSCIDNHSGAAAVTRHLIDLGHRRIGHVAGHPDYATSEQRAAGFAAAMAAAGIAVDPALIVQGDYDFVSGDRAGHALLTLPEPPTAIFAASDDMAAGVLAAAHRLGLRLPEQLSVAGFGDDPLAGYVWPPLTTVHQPTRDLGWNAADLLFAAGEGMGERRELPSEVVIRGSTETMGTDSR